MSEHSSIFREISAILGSLHPLEERVKHLERLCAQCFNGSQLVTGSQGFDPEDYVQLAANHQRGSQLIVPRDQLRELSDGEAPLAQAFIDAYALLMHQREVEHDRNSATLEIHATNQMIMALLGLGKSTTDWQRVTEGILERLFGAAAHVFALDRASETSPVAVWATKVGQTLFLCDLLDHGITIIENGKPLRSVLAAIDRSAGYGMTISTTTIHDFDATTLAILKDCLRIYIAGIAVVKHAQHRQNEDSLASAILSNLDIGVLGVNEDGRIVLANRQAGGLLGHSPSELVGSQSRAVITQFQEYFSLLGSSPTPWLATNALLRKPSGKPQPASVSVRRVETDAGANFRYLITLVDTTRSHLELEEWRWHATHDPLTGLLNRNGLAHELQRLADQPVMVLFLDINRFKTINDLLGHRGGDRVITTVAQRLITGTKPTDIVARVGGDEFVIVGSVSEQFRGLRRVAQRILGSITAQPVEIGDRQLAVSVSVGAALETFHGSIDALLDRADHAMYGAKQEGQNLRIARGDEERFSSDTQLIDPNLFDFLRARDAYQIVAEEAPWIRVADGTVAGIDLSLAWQDPIQETPRDYAIRNHLRDEYNWLLLHHLLRRQAVHGTIGASPLVPNLYFISRIERLCRANYLNPSKLQLVLRSMEFTTDELLDEGREIAARAQRLGINVALRWHSGEGGEVMSLARLRPDQVQIDLGSWTDRTMHAELANGLAAFVSALKTQSAFLHPTGKFLALLKSTRLRELMADALFQP
ncbi:sensor domain-containing diguanylate cyclase [Ferrimicrobium sp.]|uniref:sensor domain-containing diguanylate cyclase n=1 Tax=Ferrimicrobium sp. TaxID=2926050 RepID=UPI0026243D63|nr:sensor domain-containing diguanylate cyclase [Ferrimicrobium sp.]